MDEKAPSAMLTADEAHRIVGRDKISRAGFYAGIRRNEIPHRKIGKRVLIPRRAFMEWLNGQQATTS